MMLLENCSIIGDDDLNLDDFQAVLRLLVNAVSPASSSAEEHAILSIEPFGAGQLIQRVPRETRFIVAVDCNITNKVFFVVENGMFGMTYQGVQTGDTLCVFQGAKMAHLLRRRDSGY